MRRRKSRHKHEKKTWTQAYIPARSQVDHDRHFHLGDFVRSALLQATRTKSAQPIAASVPCIPVYCHRAEEAMPFPATVDPNNFKRADIQKAYRVAKIFRAFSRSSLVTAIANRKDTTGCRTVSAPSTLQPVTSASRKHHWLARCTGKVNQRRTSGQQSFAGTGII